MASKQKRHDEHDPERDIRVGWVDSITEGGCNGCHARGRVCKVELASIQFRVCVACKRELMWQFREVSE